MVEKNNIKNLEKRDNKPSLLSHKARGKGSNVYINVCVF